MCDDGYDGILCANCIGRYKRNGAFNCEECPDPGLNVIISAIYFVTLVASVVILVRITM